MKKLLLSLLITTSLGIIFYWMTVFLGLFPVEELVPGYQYWFYAFPLPDLWIAISSLIAVVHLLKNKKSAALWGITAGSSMIFLSLYAASYGFITKLIFLPTLDEYIEIAIKIYTFSVGTFFIVQFWKLQKDFSEGKEK